MTKPTVAIAADGDRLNELRGTLADLGYDIVRTLRTPGDMAQMADAAMPDAALVDLALDDTDGGIRVGRRLLELGVAVVYVTDGEDRERLDLSKDTAALGYVVEPVEPRQLDLVVGTALAIRTRRNEILTAWSDGTLRALDDISIDEAARLYRRTRLLETVFNNVADGLIVADADGNHIAMNRRAIQIAGPLGDVDLDQRAESYGLFMADGETPCRTAQLPLVRALNDKPTNDFPMVLRNPVRPAGVDLLVSARPLRDSAGKVNGAVVVIRDVTETRRIEASLKRTTADLREQKQVLADVLNTISDGIVVADENGQFIIFNPSAERILGIGASDVSQEHWSEHYGLFYPDQATEVPTEELPLVRAMNGFAVDEMEIFVRNPFIPDGAFINVNARPLLDEDGNSKGGVAMFRDVTAHYQADEALSRAFAQGRLEVMDTILHNIGNAINSVSTGVGTVSERLRNDTLMHRFAALADAMGEHEGDLAAYLTGDPQGRQALPFMRALASDLGREKGELLAMVDRVENRVGHIVEIIRTQRSFAGGSIVRKDVELGRAIADAVSVLEESLAHRGIDVTVDCDGAPECIRVEESQFNQMLVNLIRNSIEAIDERRRVEGRRIEPFVRIACCSRDGHLVIDVVDNGIGIPPDRFKSIFSPGYTTKARGSGLGLHSTANFVIGMGGRIEPISDGVGTGTTMRVSLRQVT